MAFVRLLLLLQLLLSTKNVTSREVKAAFRISVCPKKFFSRLNLFYYLFSFYNNFAYMNGYNNSKLLTCVYPDYNYTTTIQVRACLKAHKDLHDRTDAGNVFQ